MVRERGDLVLILGRMVLNLQLKEKINSLRGSFFQAMDLVKAKVAKLASAFC